MRLWFSIARLISILLIALLLSAAVTAQRTPPTIGELRNNGFMCDRTGPNEALCSRGDSVYVCNIDTRLCERSRSGALPTAVAPQTQNQTVPAVQIWRVQLRVITGRVDEAGTDDAVRVRLNGNNMTWLDYGRDDREAGSNELYDLMLDGVRNYSDIQFIEIERVGDGSWCLQGIELIVNQGSADSRWYNDCRWVRERNGRAVMLIQPVNNRPQRTERPNSLTGSDVVSLLESAFGHAIHNTYFGFDDNPGVRVSGRNNQLQVRADLQVMLDDATNPAAEVSFALDFTCANRRVVATLLSPNVRYGTGIGLAGFTINPNPAFYSVSTRRLEETINRMTDSCSVRVLDDGGLRFGPR